MDPDGCTIHGHAGFFPIRQGLEDMAGVESALMALLAFAASFWGCADRGKVRGFFTAFRMTNMEGSAIGCWRGLDALPRDL